AAILIQKVFKGEQEKRKLAQLNENIAKVQALRKGVVTRRILLEKKRNLLLIESRFLAYLERKRRLIKCQRFVRSYLARRKVENMQLSAIKIQRAWRSFKDRKMLLQKRESALSIQLYWNVLKNSEKMENAALFIQQFWRAYWSNKCLNLKKRHQSADSISRLWFTFKTRRELNRLHFHACTIQKMWRGYCVRCWYIE